MRGRGRRWKGKRRQAAGGRWQVAGSRNVALGGVVGEEARAAYTEAPSLTRPSECGGAVAALRGGVAAEANVLIGRVHRHGVGAPVPGVLGRKVLEKVELGRPELSRDEGCDVSATVGVTLV